MMSATAIFSLSSMPNAGARRTPRAPRARPRRASCRHCRRRDRPRPCRRTSAACVCAAQPVTTMRASGPLALQPADRLPRLRHGLVGDRAAVDDDGVGEPGALGLARDHFGFEGVEAAAEGDDVDAHAQATEANSAGSNRPSYSNVAVPVISTWSSRSRHSMREFAAGQRDLHDAIGAPSAAPPPPRWRRPPSRRPWSAPRRAPRCGS